MKQANIFIKRKLADKSNSMKMIVAQI